MIFVYWKQYCFITRFFLIVRTIIEISGKSLFKDEQYSCQWTSIVSIFSRKHIEKTYFSTNPSSGQWKRIFCLMETMVFDQNFFSASGNDYWNQRTTVFKEKAYSCQWTTDSPGSGNHFSVHVLKTPADNSFFLSSEKVFFGEILYFSQQKRILELIMVSTSMAKAVNKRILFTLHQTKILIPPSRKQDSLKRYTSTTWKSRFHRQEYLKQKTVENGFQQQQKSYSIKIASPQVE